MNFVKFRAKSVLLAALVLLSAAVAYLMMKDVSSASENSMETLVTNSEAAQKHECLKIIKRRHSWYGPAAYPIVASEQESWNWSLAFLTGNENRPLNSGNFAANVGDLIAATMRTERSRRQVARVRFAETEPNPAEDYIFTAILQSRDQQLREVMLPRAFCNKNRCRNNTLLRTKLSHDVLAFDALVDDFYDMLQLLHCQNQAQYLIITIKTEPQESMYYDRYSTMLYDFLSVLYFELDWIPFETDISGCKASHYNCTFSTAWKKYNPRDDTVYFPPAGDGSLANELQRLASHFVNPYEEYCTRREIIGGAYIGEAVAAKVDGRYTVCMDVLNIGNPKSCLVYSFGINGDWDFDDAMHSLGCTVFSFDPSLKTDSYQRGANHYYYNWGLVTNHTASKLPSEWTIKTIRRIYSELGHANRTIDVLKMDCETPELTFIDSDEFLEMAPKIKQFIMEVHYLPMENFVAPSNFDGPQTVRNISKLLHKMEKMGFALFYSRPTPRYWGMIDFRSYDRKTTLFTGRQALLYELSYINLRYN